MRALVPREDAMVEVLADDRVLDRALQDVVEEVFGLGELAHHTPRVGDVTCRREDTEDVAAGILVDGRVVEDVRHPAVAVPDRQRIVGHKTLCENLLVALTSLVRLGEVVGEVGPNKLLSWNPGYLDRRL